MEDNKKNLENDDYFNDENYCEVNEEVENIIENFDEYIELDDCEEYQAIEAETEIQDENIEDFDMQDEKIGRKVFSVFIWILSSIYIITAFIKMTLIGSSFQDEDKTLLIISFVAFLLGLLIIRFSYAIAFKNLKNFVYNKDVEPSAMYVLSIIVIGLTFYAFSIYLLFQ